MYKNVYLYELKISIKNVQEYLSVWIENQYSVTVRNSVYRQFTILCSEYIDSYVSCMVTKCWLNLQNIENTAS